MYQGEEQDPHLDLSPKKNKDEADQCKYIENKSYRDNKGIFTTMLLKCQLHSSLRLNRMNQSNTKICGNGHN